MFFPDGLGRLLVHGLAGGYLTTMIMPVRETLFLKGWAIWEE